MEMPGFAFERCTDYALIRAILTEPRCYRRMAGRAQREADALDVCRRPDIEYVLAREDGGAVAVFLLAKGDEVHFCFVPAAWGRSEPIARAFLAWAWASTATERLVGIVPLYNRLALRLARRVGFVEYSRNERDAFLEIRKSCSRSPTTR